ncbi:MAG: DUF6069 family protein [Trebonia sp.]
MSAIATPALRDSRQNWMRALCVAGAAAAAAIVWAIEVPLLGIRLSIRFGAMRPETVVAGQVVGAAIVAALLGWLLLAVLERRLPRSRATWTGAAVAVLIVSLALPLAAATTTSAAAGLIALHLAVGAAVIPGMSIPGRSVGTGRR